MVGSNFADSILPNAWLCHTRAEDGLVGPAWGGERVPANRQRQQYSLRPLPARLELGAPVGYEGGRQPFFLSDVSRSQIHPMGGDPEVPTCRPQRTAWPGSDVLAVTKASLNRYRAGGGEAGVGFFYLFRVPQKSMKSKLTVEKREDGDWTVVDVQTHLDRPRLGAVLTTPDLHVMNQANTWEITHRDGR